MATALKEWAIVCDALERGEQSLLLRKGGIREKRPGFTVEHRNFFLYPTAFHQNPLELVPTARGRLTELPVPPTGLVPIALYAEVIESWRVEQFDRLEALRGMHILEPATVESRYYYRGNPWLEVVLLRVFRLPQTVLVKELSEYAGCHSWVTLADELPTLDRLPILSEGQLSHLKRQLQDKLKVQPQAPLK